MPKLLFCRGLHEDAMAVLSARKDMEALFLTHDFRGPPMTEELAATIAGADGVMVGLEKVPDVLLATAPRLKVISRFGVGYDSVDVPACTSRGILLGVPTAPTTSRSPNTP